MVRDLFRKSLSALTAKQTNIFSAAFYIFATTILAQLLGIFKYRLLVSVFGASDNLGVFFAAFRIPDVIMQVLITAAVSSAFIPLFSDFLVKDKKEEAYSFTSTLITLGLVAYIVIALFVSIFAQQLSMLIAPGFSPAQLELMTQLTRIILLSQVFMILGTVVTAVLQSFQHFLIPGIAAALYNLGIIVGLLLFTPLFGIYGAAIGVVLGSVLFFLFQLPLMKGSWSIFKPRFAFTTEIKKLYALSIPRGLTLLVVGLGSMVSVFFASFISPKSYVYFDLAQTLMLAPVLLFGQSIAQASFPALAQKVHDKKEFVSIFLSSFGQIVYLTLPVSVLFIVLRIPLVRLFYGASRFDWEATVATGMTLSFFALSIFAQALIYLFSRVFYAYKDTKTPLIVTVGSIGIYIFLAYIFILVGGQSIHYLAFSYSVANIFSVIVLLWYVNKRIELPKWLMVKDFIKIAVATIIMGICLYIPIKLLDQLVFDTTRTINLMMLTGIASAAGFAAFIFFTWLLNIKEAYVIIAVLKKFGKWDKMLKQLREPIEGSRLNP